MYFASIDWAADSVTAISNDVIISFTFCRNTISLLFTGVVVV